MKLKTITLALLSASFTSGIAHACTSVAWNTVQLNVYDMMGKEFRLPLTESYMVKF